MKRKAVFALATILGVLLTACGTASPAPQSSSPDISPAGSDAANPSTPAAPIGTPATQLTALQLAAGMLKLDGTANAVTPQEAGQLLPLWQSLQQIESSAVPQGGAQATPGSRPSGAMFQQVTAQIQTIENAMPRSQIRAITSLNLSRQDIFTVFQQAGITMGAPGGGAFARSGGTFTPPQGTPRAARTPGAYPAGGGSFNGGRQGFGNFIPGSVVNGIVQYLQTKANG